MSNVSSIRETFKDRVLHVPDYQQGYAGYDQPEAVKQNLPRLPGK